MPSQQADDHLGRGLYATPLTKTEMAYRQIRQEIIEGLLGPNTVIDQEALALRLGLSTTPVREALRLLESENLVINRRHRNTVVTPLDYDLLEETYSVRLSLDPLAVAFAAVKATDAEREFIKTLVHQELPDPTPVETMHANRRLHRAIYAASGNSVLTQVLDTLWDRSDRYRMVTVRNDTHARIAHHEHHAIVDAVLAGDAETAAALMRDHVGESLQRIREESRTPQ
jgi:DNA-binding GntR family transcriptional regulator